MTEPNSFELFMRNYQDMVFTTAFRLLGNESDAEDISQEVFLKAYRDFAMLRDNPSAGGWLKTVARNLCLNHLSRYRARWQFFSEIFSRENDEDEREVEFASPVEFSHQVEDADRRRLIYDALMKLPASQRVPIVLYHYEGLSYEEIAKSLKVSLSKAKTDIHRGREALRERLKKLRGELESESFPTPRRRDEQKSSGQLDASALLAFARHELRA
jgi:RNA polymerase sigma-70 factor, ECF subfamily